MLIETITPSRAVDNAFLQETITSKDFEQFRTRLLKLINSADTAVENEESEEHLKNLIKPFLDHTNFGEDYYINTKERQDLAIHNGKTGSSTVGVILEAKRPLNKEMITGDDINRKAFHEAILYYLRERIENNNEDIKHIIITDVYRWFVFDAQDFERFFHDSKKLRGWYSEWKKGQKVSSKTQFVYDHLSEFIQDLDESIKSTVFDIRDYKTLLEKEELGREEQKKLVPLFKLFTPTHLLKLPFASDSNNLNKGFYRELLYIMGLQEYKEKGTHYITRLNEDERNPASLIENTITQLESLNVLSQISNRAEYGETDEEQLFNIAIQLLITWVNRILFLKLLEAQLYKYHREDDRFRFLNHREIKEYDGLNKLFFQVLAVPEKERSERISENYSHIPYLNSSLFDVADIERAALRISELEDGLQLPVYSRSKIRNREGDRLKGESISALEYLLRFLDAYSFNTEGTAEVQEEAKTLINASVLGRIFEKINGYKDGSFFTPGYITEYMCRETIRRAVVQKFNEAFADWNCDTIEDLRSKIARHEVSYEKSNAIVNSTAICDPAVGSGHFLVSALNEMIAIKHDMRIFVDEHNERIRDVDISVDNDELRISIGSDPFFEYRVEHDWKEDGSIKRTVGSDTQRLQRALFREKNILIENCLFGVDINPNSVNICRLRLWVELLKHAYYRADTDYQSLEVLPNIDINIKQGNSLVSRFGLDADLSQILSNNDDLTIKDYKRAVRSYKETGDREDKRALKEQISSIKEGFSVGLKELHPVRQKLKKQREILIKEEAKLDLFEGDKKSKKEQKKITKTKKKIGKLEEDLAELENATFYDQAFEWRFEFPEVLDEDGEFIGFDAVIGNPPYIAKTFDDSFKEYLKNNYETSEYQLDYYVAFIELGVKIGRQGSLLSYITPNSWVKNLKFSECRRFLLDNTAFKRMAPYLDNVFEDANVDSLVFITEKTTETDKIKVDYYDDGHWLFKHSVNQERFRNNHKNIFDVHVTDEVKAILEKIEASTVKLKELCDITRGVNAYDRYRGQSPEVIKKRAYHADNKRDETFLPELKGKHVNSFYYDWAGDTFISYGDWLAAPREKKYFEGERIVLRQVLGDRLKCSIIKEEFIIDQTVFIAKPNPKPTFDFIPEYVVGLIASKIFMFYFQYTLSEFDDLFPKVKIGEFRIFPIRQANKNTQKEIAAEVNKVFKIKKDDPKTDTSEFEEKIDQLVYELYGLSAEDVEIVEESIG